MRLPIDLCSFYIGGSDREIVPSCKVPRAIVDAPRKEWRPLAAAASSIPKSV
jgi:hypothetical protein